MLEAGVPEGVIREVVGHVDPAMTCWYSHPRLEAKRAAVQVLGAVRGGSVAPTYGTKHGTKDLLEEKVEAKSLKEWRALGDDFRTLPISEIVRDIPQLDQISLQI